MAAPMPNSEYKMKLRKHSSTNPKTQQEEEEVLSTVGDHLNVTESPVKEKDTAQEIPDKYPDQPTPSVSNTNNSL